VASGAASHSKEHCTKQHYHFGRWNSSKLLRIELRPYLTKSMQFIKNLWPKENKRTLQKSMKTLDIVKSPYLGESESIRCSFQKMQIMHCYKQDDYLVFILKKMKT
jgi:hypothetical protein